MKLSKLFENVNDKLNDKLFNDKLKSIKMDLEKAFNTDQVILDTPYGSLYQPGARHGQLTLYMVIDKRFLDNIIQSKIKKIIDDYYISDYHRFNEMPPESEIGSKPGHAIFAYLNLPPRGSAISIILSKKETKQASSYDKVYHVSKLENLHSILKNGLKPSNSRAYKGRTYVFGNKKEAIHFSNQWFNYTKSVLFEIDPTGINFQEDWEFGPDSSAMWTKSNISPQAIKRHKILF